MPKKNHVHIYKRLKTRKNAYRCMDPDCTYLITKDLLEGKRALCSRCKQNELIITPENLRRAEFWCDDCSNSKDALRRRENKKVAAKILAVAIDTLKQEDALETVEEMFNNPFK